ncbi:MAG: hypothetical protein ABI970_06455 [Chloroflexota bacterium]|nr:hypothetical protein [Anaerolineae bacterium]
MPYKVAWFVEKRVLLSRYEGIITIEDARGQVREGNALLREGIPLTHSIIDMSAVEKLPSLQLASEFMSIDMSDVRDKLGWTIVVTNNKFLKFASSLFVPIFKVRQRFFGSLDEALAFLQEEDNTLPPLKK